MICWHNIHVLWEKTYLPHTNYYDLTFWFISKIIKTGKTHLTNWIFIDNYWQGKGCHCSMLSLQKKNKNNQSFKFWKAKVTACKGNMTEITVLSKNTLKLLEPCNCIQTIPHCIQLVMETNGQHCPMFNLWFRCGLM